MLIQYYYLFLHFLRFKVRLSILIWIHIISFFGQNVAKGPCQPILVVSIAVASYGTHYFHGQLGLLLRLSSWSWHDLLAKCIPTKELLYKTTDYYTLMDECSEWRIQVGHNQVPLRPPQTKAHANIVKYKRVTPLLGIILSCNFNIKLKTNTICTFCKSYV